MKTLGTNLSRGRRKFLRLFPRAFRDPTYLAYERDYKVEACAYWQTLLSPPMFRQLIARHDFAEIARRALSVEQKSKHPMIFSFEKMALRDAVRTPAGARDFSLGLYAFLHGRGGLQSRFNHWVATVVELPRKQTRVLTWPIVTVFGFLARPQEHVFFKPLTVRAAAEELNYELPYSSRPNWNTYASLLALAAELRHDLADLGPRDMIDIQSFLWVLGSAEYAD